MSLPPSVPNEIRDGLLMQHGLLQAEFCILEVLAVLVKNEKHFILFSAIKIIFL